jgi:hypothetical protein
MIHTSIALESGSRRGIQCHRAACDRKARDIVISGSPAAPVGGMRFAVNSDFPARRSSLMVALLLFLHGKLMDHEERGCHESARHCGASQKT